jgi:putative oxidoreductase
MVKRILGTDAASWAALPVRLALGAIFLAHGAQKLFGWFGGHGLTATAGFFEEKLGMAPGLLWAGLAGGGEFLGGLLVLLGLATRFGALTLAVTMLVAIIKVHWGAFFLPAGIEYPLALLAASLALIVSGGGALSLDALLLKKLAPRTRPAPAPAHEEALA